MSCSLSDKGLKDWKRIGGVWTMKQKLIARFWEEQERKKKDLTKLGEKDLLKMSIHDIASNARARSLWPTDPFTMHLKATPVQCEFPLFLLPPLFTVYLFFYLNDYLKYLFLWLVYLLILFVTVLHYHSLYHITSIQQFIHIRSFKHLSRRERNFFDENMGTERIATINM